MGDRLYQKKPGGAWYGWYYEPGGRRIVVCTRCKDQRAARTFLRRAERAAHGTPDTASDAAGHTVTHAVDYLVDQGCHDVSPWTRRMYEGRGGHVRRLLGSIDVGLLELDDVKGYTEIRTKEGAHRETVRKELVTLRRALVLAKDRSILKKEPSLCFPSWRVRAQPRRRWLTLEEYQRLRARVRGTHKTWLDLAVYTGGRREEVNSVGWEHIDWTRGESGWIYLPGTKTRKSARWVPIRGPLRALLWPIRQDAGPIAGRWGNVVRDLGDACVREGIDRAGPNDLRRTFASWMKQAGVDSYTVARWMGHTSSRMVELVYGQLDDEALEAAARAADGRPRRRRRPVANG